MMALSHRRAPIKPSPFFLALVTTKWPFCRLGETADCGRWPDPKVSPMDVTLSEVKPNLVQVARVEEALSKLARQAAPPSSDQRILPIVDPTMRSVGGDNELVWVIREQLYGRTARTLSRILLIAGLGAAATLGWLASSPPQPGESSMQPVVDDARNGPVTGEHASQSTGLATVEKATSEVTAEQESKPAGHAIVEEARPQPSPAARATTDTTVSAATPAPSLPAPSQIAIEQLQTMAQDVASLRHQVEQLMAGQEQLVRTIAKLQSAERDTRRRKPKSQAVVHASKPLAPLPPPPQTQPSPPAATPEAPPPRPPASIR